MNLQDLTNYIKYSGASVCITLNPLHWNIWPHFNTSRSWSDESTKSFTWLFLTVRIWIDDGSW